MTTHARLKLRGWTPEEAQRRRAERDAYALSSRWAVALAFCGLTLGEIAHVLGITLTEARQRLYFFGFLSYDVVQVPAAVPPEWRELFALDTPDNDNLPAALRAFIKANLPQ